MRPSIRSLKQAMKRVPLVRAALEQRSKRRFAGDSFGSHWGVFRTFEEARRSAPPTRPVGFHVPAYANVHLDRVHGVLPYDYPVLLWLAPVLAKQVAVFDFGGNVGVHYYGYARYIPYRDDLTWTVCELPVLIAKGKAIASGREAPHLSFTEKFERADGADVLLAAGVLQYVEGPSLPELLAPLVRKPKHVFLNKLPLHDGEAFVTLQNGGPTSLPQHVFNRVAFLADFERLGYTVVDQWEVPGFSCMIPSDPARSVSSYSGCYLRLGA